MHGRSKHAMAAVFLASTLLVSGCAQDIRKTGYYPLEQELAQVQVGASTRADVIAALGAPSVDAGDNGPIYYIGQRTQYIGPLSPRLVDRQVIAISFGANGRVTEIETLSAEDGAEIAVSGRITEPMGEGLSLWRQLFGNIGNVDAGQLIGN